MIENDAEKGFKLPRARPVRMNARTPGNDTVPPEAWDREHPDHAWWVNGRGWCYDPACTDHTFGRPAGKT